MNKKIAILRGINVGGNRKILMADLKSVCAQLGWINVQSYIQSGNLIFESEQKNSELETSLQAAILEHFGHDVPVIVRTHQELQQSIQNNPFLTDQADISQLLLTFLKEHPDKDLIDSLQNPSDTDQYKLQGKDIFLFCTGKYHTSKLTNQFFEKKLKVVATTRNWKTVMKLIELSSLN